ncbi:MAG: hypothetical protein H0W78_06440 [Planctomycetes bacterium]|nr:hypothetical protein [Planctomycetota bacterium]
MVHLRSLVLGLLVGLVVPAWSATAPEERKADRERTKAMQALLEEASDTSVAGIDRRLGGGAPATAVRAKKAKADFTNVN